MATSASVDYEQKKHYLLEELQKQNRLGGTLRLKKKTSNLFRHREKSHEKWLNLMVFNRVIRVDPVHLVAEVEGLTTYEDFVNETLKYDCLPAIVPELKSITIGGAIAGLGAESSSFRFGWVHETASEIEVLLSHGEVVIASPNNEHRDLFYALPGSYGTLGYVLKATLRLIPVKPFVRLSRFRFTDPAAYFSKLMELVENPASDGPIDYIDGVSLGNELFITVGRFVDQAPTISNYKFMHIYYQSIPQKKEDYLTALDYIWRWDTDWFWCSKYFLMHNRFFRFLLGKFLLKSTAYGKIMRLINSNTFFRWTTEAFGPRTETIIQDLQIPAEKALEFYQFFKNEMHIDPMLICPIRLNAGLSPFLFCKMDKNKWYINFGAYGNFIPSDQAPGYFNKKIEKKVSALNGNKWLYSNVFYSEQEFWRLYEKSTYEALKKKYDPHNFLTDIYTKCSEKM